MKIVESNRGFRSVTHPVYPPDSSDDDRLIAESSVIYDYEDALSKPGSSALWFGTTHHLDRGEVLEVIDILGHWLKHGRLPAQSGPK